MTLSPTLTLRTLALGLSLTLAAAPDPAGLVFPVEDAFYINGRGVVVTGRVMRGQVKAGDVLELVGNGPERKVTVRAVEAFRRTLTSAKAGDDCGLLVSGVERADVQRGQVLAVPGSLRAVKSFEAETDWNESSKGGLKNPATSPFRPMLSIYTALPSATLTFAQPITPGATKITVHVELSQPVALEKGQSFSIRMGSQIVGSGRVSELPSP